MSDEGIVCFEFVCTDRGQHRERVLGIVWEDHGLRGAATPERAGRGVIVEEWRAATGRGLELARCPTCGRDVRLPADRVRALWDAGLTRVDVSLIP